MQASEGSPSYGGRHYAQADSNSCTVGHLVQGRFWIPRRKDLEIWKPRQYLYVRGFVPESIAKVFSVEVVATAWIGI